MVFEHVADPTVVLFIMYPDIRDGDAGWFTPGDPHVYIDMRLSPFGRELVYIHEDQHRQCSDEKCFCHGRYSHYWSEYHAFRAELQQVLAQGDAGFTHYYLRRVFELLRKRWNDPRCRTHIRALSRVVKSEAFRSCARKHGFGSKWRYWTRKERRRSCKGS